MDKFIKAKTVYIDFIGQEFDSKQEAENSNHKIHLRFRKYIENELLVFFRDGGLDKIGTSRQLWDSLEFTPECIRSIDNIMLKDS